MFGMPIVSDPQVGEYWTHKSLNETYLLDKKDTINFKVLYHFLDDKTQSSVGWYTKENLLANFIKWIDPWEKTKEVAKRDGWVWRENI